MVVIWLCLPFLFGDINLCMQFFPTTEDSINYYNQKRCVDGKGLVLPSQLVIFLSSTLSGFVTNIHVISLYVWFVWSCQQFSKLWGLWNLLDGGLVTHPKGYAKSNMGFVTFYLWQRYVKYFERVLRDFNGETPIGKK
jgi:hypothetical protein